MLLKLRKVDEEYLSNSSFNILIRKLQELGVYEKYINNTEEGIREHLSKKYSKEKMSESALLTTSFNFKDSPEGYKFWIEVCRNLKNK